MIADTSAWIEFLRATGSATHHRMRELLQSDAELLVPELVLMEVCSGPTDDHVAARLQSMLFSFEVVPLVPTVDSVEAAALARRCRRAGQTVRSSLDCMIAAVALRLDQVVLHRDRDFEVLAQHVGLRTEFHPD